MDPNWGRSTGFLGSSTTGSSTMGYVTLDYCVLPFTIPMVLKIQNHLEDLSKHKLVCLTPWASKLVGWGEAQEFAFPTEFPGICYSSSRAQAARTTVMHTSPNLFLFVWLFATPWTAARQSPLLFTISQSLFKFTSIELVMLSNHVILYCPFSFCPQSFNINIYIIYSILIYIFTLLYT